MKHVVRKVITYETITAFATNVVLFTEKELW